MNKLVIGLTGPTGAGKSTWGEAFRALYCAVVDCDKLARRAVEEPDCLRALQNAFGQDVARDGTLDRRLLAARAFADREKTALLNRITHPVIRELLLQALQKYQKSDCKAIFVDAPQLYESGLDRLCDRTAAVLAPREVRVERLLSRDRVSREELLQRMSVQHDDDFFRAHAQDILDGALPRERVTEAAREYLSNCLRGRA